MINWKGLVNYRFWRHRLIYPLISVVVALSLCLSTPLPGRAIDLLPLILQGAQLFQLSNISIAKKLILVNRSISNYKAVIFVFIVIHK
jgi:hypothetical protein